MTEIAGRVAVVTGGGSGIGRGLALALADEGVPVVVADILEENAAAVVSEINQAGGRALAVVCDVTDRSSVRKMKAAANHAFGPVSLLFANAGATMFEPLTKMSDDDVDWILQVNLFGVSNCVHIFLPDMLTANSGHIVATASLAGILSAYMDDHAPYAAAKAGVIGMMLSLRYELRDSGVGCSVLCPGGVKSRITESPRYRPARFGGPQPASVTLPTGGHGDQRMKFRPAEEVAQMVLRAVERNRAVIMTDATTRHLFKAGYVDAVNMAYDDVEEFDKAKA